MTSDRDRDYGPQRDSWMILVPAIDVLAAAKAKREHHEERLKAWREKEIQAEKDIRENGIGFREAARPRAAARSGKYDPEESYVGAAFSSNTQYAAEPSFDQKLLRNLQEAQERVAAHLDFIRTYMTWEKMLSLIPDHNSVRMTIADVEFFDMGATVQFKIPELAGVGADGSTE